MNNQQSNQNSSEKNSMSISAEELKSKLESKQPLMVFDIGEQSRYEEAAVYS